MRILVAGALANKPGNGGEAWVRLNWILGLQALGMDVYFVEQIGRAALVDGHGRPSAFQTSVNRSYFSSVVERFGLADRAALVCDDGQETAGMSLAALHDLASGADLLVNISGHLTLPGVVCQVRRRAYVDIDPGFTQFWHASGLAAIDGHESYFTIGANIGQPWCPIPTCGRRWHPVVQPVVLDEWPVTAHGGELTFTTVARWRGSFGRLEHAGRTFGQKAHEFRKFSALPRRAPRRYEIALDIDPGDAQDRRLLVDSGWTLVAPEAAAADPDRFRAFVQRSGAEFSVAQGIYVDTESGWFSDRTTRYLASGKPALVQDTGFTRTLPAGKGLVAFRTLDEAVRGAESIASDYAAHAAAARALAERCFDARAVLPPFLDVALEGGR